MSVERKKYIYSTVKTREGQEGKQKERGGRKEGREGGREGGGREREREGRREGEGGREGGRERNSLVKCPLDYHQVNHECMVEVTKP